jgi:GNAT superfamily N-acetyltransferase
MADRDYDPFEIVPFDASCLGEVRRVAREVLCHEYGARPDLSGEHDLADVQASFAPPHSRFLVAKVLGRVVATAGLSRISDLDCELRHLYVLSQFRRRGIASALVADLIAFVRQRGYKRVLLELRPEMEDTAQGYPRYGFVPESSNLPRPGTFLAIRL